MPLDPPGIIRRFNAKPLRKDPSNDVGPSRIRFVHVALCRPKGGRHGFIKKASYAVYEFAIQRHKNFVDGKASKGIYRKHKRVKSEVVAKIAAGVKKSPETKKHIKDGYDACIRATEKRQKEKVKLGE